MFICSINYYFVLFFSTINTYAIQTLLSLFSGYPWKSPSADSSLDSPMPSAFLSRGIASSAFEFWPTIQKQRHLTHAAFPRPMMFGYPNMVSLPGRQFLSSDIDKNNNCERRRTDSIASFKSSRNTDILTHDYPIHPFELSMSSLSYLHAQYYHSVNTRHLNHLYHPYFYCHGGNERQKTSNFAQIPSPEVPNKFNTSKTSLLHGESLQTHMMSPKTPTTPTSPLSPLFLPQAPPVKPTLQVNTRFHI